MVTIQKPKSANQIYLVFQGRDDGNKKGVQGYALKMVFSFFWIKINSAADWAHKPCKSFIGTMNKEG